MLSAQSTLVIPKPVLNLPEYGLAQYVQLTITASVT